jgi:hypothetical protein
MSAVVIEHVKVGDLPEAWRERLARPSDARVTVRIEDETGRQETAATRLTAGEAIEDPPSASGATATTWPMSMPTCARFARLDTVVTAPAPKAERGAGR